MILKLARLGHIDYLSLFRVIGKRPFPRKRWWHIACMTWMTGLQSAATCTPAMCPPAPPCAPAPPGGHHLHHTFNLPSCKKSHCWKYTPYSTLGIGQPGTHRSLCERLYGFTTLALQWTLLDSRQVFKHATYLQKTVHCAVKWDWILTGKMGLSFGSFSYSAYIIFIYYILLYINILYIIIY